MRPFYVDGKELLCMRCAHLGEYEVFLDEVHNKDVFKGECHELNKLVGLPMNECEHFKEKKSLDEPSLLYIDHMLRCEVEGLLEKLEDLDDIHYEIIERNFKSALSTINDELYALEEE